MMRNGRAIVLANQVAKKPSSKPGVMNDAIVRRKYFLKHVGIKEFMDARLPIQRIVVFPVANAQASNVGVGPCADNADAASTCAYSSELAQPQATTLDHHDTN